MESYNHLISIEKPEAESQPSKVFVDSVKIVSENNREVLLIGGSFPDACTKLKEATHQTEEDSLYLELTAWRSPDEMCAQVLTPFTYMYDQLSKEELNSHSEIKVNGTTFSIK